MSPRCHLTQKLTVTSLGTRKHSMQRCFWKGRFLLLNDAAKSYQYIVLLGLNTTTWFLKPNQKTNCLSYVTLEWNEFREDQLVECNIMDTKAIEVNSVHLSNEESCHDYYCRYSNSYWHITLWIQVIMSA